MPGEQQGFTIQAPFGGLRTAVSAYALDPNQFSTGLNVVNDDGLIKPRPGYTNLNSTPFANYPVGGFCWNRSRTGTLSGNCHDYLIFQTHSTSSAATGLYYYDRILNTEVEVTTGFPLRSAGYGRFVTNNRDTDPADDVTPLTADRRLCYAYMGGGLTAYSGGVLIGTGYGAYVYNMVLPGYPKLYKNILKVAVTPDAGNYTFTLTRDGQATANITQADNAAAIKAIISNAWTNLGTPARITKGLSVHKTGAGPVYIFVAFGGDFNYDTQPTITGSASVGTGFSVTQLEPHPGGLVMFRPAGLPTPVLNARAPTTPAANYHLWGQYQWKVTFYSTLLNLESPASNFIPSDGAGYGVKCLQYNRMFMNVTIPDSMYFDPFQTSVDKSYDAYLRLLPLVDKIRIYRRRVGGPTGEATDTINGVGAWSDFKFSCEFDINKNVAGTWSGATVFSNGNGDTCVIGYVPGSPNVYVVSDDVSDQEVEAQSESLPAIEYPPDDTALVEIGQGRAHYSTSGSGDNTVWYSAIGRLEYEELGYEYVDSLSYYTVDGVGVDDTGITGLRWFGENLIIFTPSKAFSANYSDEGGGGVVVRQLKGAAGCASHWCIKESNVMADKPGFLLYPNADGLFAFDGSSTLMVADFSGLGLARYTAPSGTSQERLYSWYWADADIDPANHRYLLSHCKYDSGTDIRSQICYSLRTGTVFEWNIPAWMVLASRNQTTLNAEMLIGRNGYLSRLEPAGYDHSANFTWSLKTGHLPCGMPGITKVFHGFDANWELSSIGSASDVTMGGLLDNGTTVSSAIHIAAPDRWSRLADLGRGRTIQLQLSGTVTNSATTRPALVSMIVYHQPTGTRT